ncbi:MAG: hypothetical protein ABI877_19170 [Gemmatimonadaceae bacterium]
MTALTKFFFRENALSRPNAMETIAWWESRRLAYNAAIGTVGVVTLAAINLIWALPPNPSPLPWQANVFPPLIYGVMANVCYTMGWAAELGMRRWLGDEVEPAGPALFRYGFAFSVGLTLFPLGLTCLAWLARLARAVFLS